MGGKFWSYTPAEFNAIANGYFRREQRKWHRAAWMVCWMVAPFSKQNLKPHKILPDLMTRTFPHSLIED